MFHILIVEDDFHVKKLLETILNINGYHTYPVNNSLEALELLDKQHIDLIVLDIMLPYMSGYEFTKLLRSYNYLIPILIVTAKSLQEDLKKAFLAGADDYMTKPFDNEELLLRIQALLRRSKIVNNHNLTIGKITLDYNSLLVTRENLSFFLPQKEFYLLYKLLSYPNKIFTRLQLMDEIWGMDSDTTDLTVNVHINRLRKRFADFTEFEIQTVRGLGYRAVIKYEK